MNKIYATPQGGVGAEVRYSRVKCMGVRKPGICGNPEREHISTSHIERPNLTKRMSMRRFTRLTNAFSKKLMTMSSDFMYYNFARTHQTLGVTLAMAAGVSDHVWSIEEMVKLLDTPHRNSVVFM